MGRGLTVKPQTILMEALLARLTSQLLFVTESNELQLFRLTRNGEK